MQGVGRRLNGYTLRAFTNRILNADDFRIEKLRAHRHARISHWTRTMQQFPRLNIGFVNRSSSYAGQDSDLQALTPEGNEERTG